MHIPLSVSRRAAFTLLEMMIVMVIVSLSVGAVLAARELIHASEIQSIVSDYQRYSTASQGFRDKYGARPGDISNATQYFGYDNSGIANCANRTSTTITTPKGVCDGNGNNELNPGNANEPSEDFQFWRHLAAAEFIGGSYTGKAGPLSADHTLPSVNTPKTRIASNSAWFTHYWGPQLGCCPLVTHLPVGDYGNSFEVGMVSASWDPNESLFTPAELYSLDVKLDDGKPGRGTLVARNYSTFGSTEGCTNAADGTNLDGEYRTPIDKVLCVAIFRKQF